MSRPYLPKLESFCSVVKAKLFYGARRSKNSQRTLVLQSAFFNNFVCLPFDDAAATIFGNI